MWYLWHQNQQKVNKAGISCLTNEYWLLRVKKFC